MGTGPEGSVFGENSFYREMWGTRRGGGHHVAKCSSDHRQTLPEVKLQGRDLVRVVDVVAPFAPLGAGTRGKFVLSSPRGEMGPGDVCRVPLVAVRHGRARQTSETGPCGDCRRVLWVPGARCQYSGEIRLMQKHGVQDEGCRHVAKHSSEPPGSLPRSQTSWTGHSASSGYCRPL